MTEAVVVAADYDRKGMNNWYEDANPRPGVVSEQMFQQLYKLLFVSLLFAIDNRLGSRIRQALERLFTEIWVRGLFRFRASSIETFGRILELNLDDLDISALIFPHFCSNDFSETWLWYVSSQCKLIPQIK